MHHMNLKEKFRATVVISAIIVFLVAGIGLWRYNQFDRDSALIQSASTELQAELENSFTNIQLMGEIQTDLTSFIQTADPEYLEKVIVKSQSVLASLPRDERADFRQFLNKVNTLEIRMESLRLNNKKAIEAGNNILTTIGRYERCENNTQCIQALGSAGEAYTKYLPIYTQSLLKRQKEELDSSLERAAAILEAIVKELMTISDDLPDTQRSHITQTIDLFYDLDDAISTVAAIRQTVLESENEVISDLNDLTAKFASRAIEQNDAASSLMEHSLEEPKNFAILMFSILAVLILLFVLFEGFMYRSIIFPLVNLVHMLKSFSKVLAGVRRKTLEGNESYDLLGTIDIKRQDEIGDVVRATKELIERMRSISEFRLKIEADASTEEVYFRLAKVFTTELNLHSFVIYEIASDDSMVPVFSHPQELQHELPDFTVSNTCRAKRTGTITSSFGDPDLCRTYPHRDALDHFCIPMLISGQVMGVLQFLLPISFRQSQKREVLENLSEAQSYLEEALPILQAKRFAKKLERMATKDQLTGLFNRRYLELSLPQIVSGIKRRKTRLGILMCDMDYFKQINDTYGHDAGDIVLTELSSIFVNCVRTSDLVIRFGGEEFLILLQDVDADEGMLVAEKIRMAVEAHLFAIAGAEISKTVSIGVSEFPNGKAKGIWESIKHADVALYKAKDQGRNRVVQFSEEMWQEAKY